MLFPFWKVGDSPLVEERERLHTDPNDPETRKNRKRKSMKVKERHFESSNVQLYFPTKNKKDHLRKLDPDAGATFLW